MEAATQLLFSIINNRDIKYKDSPEGMKEAGQASYGDESGHGSSSPT